MRNAASPPLLKHAAQLNSAAMRSQSAIPLSTLALRALAAQRTAAAAAPGAAPAAAAPLPRLHPSLLALHGLPAAPTVSPAALPRAARAASRALGLGVLPPSVRPGHWALPESLPPKTGLRLASALALRLPAALRQQGPDLPLLLQEVLRQLGRSLTAPGHAKSEAKSWPTLRALAPAVQACVGALLGSGEGSLASATFAQAEREALAGALVARFLRLLAAFDGAAPGAAPDGAPSHRLALALQLCSALPPSAAAQCAPAMQALRARLGEPKP
jgi:hypothetical protein